MCYSIHSRIAGLGLGIAAVAGVLTGASFAQSPDDPASAGVTILTVGGGSASALRRFQAPSYEVADVQQRRLRGAPKIGEATAVFDISQDSSLLPWISATWEGGPARTEASVRIADQDYNLKRGIDMGACVITGIEWPELKASDGKKHFEVTARWQAQNLRFTSGGGVLLPLQQPSDDGMFTPNFTVTMMDIQSEWIVSVALPKVTPRIARRSQGRDTPRVPVYEAPEFGTLTIEIAPDGIAAASAMAARILQDGNCEEGEFQDILIDMKDQSLKKVLGTFTLVGCGLKTFNWAPKLEGGKEGLATATMEFLVEDFRYRPAVK
jgi:hypothetical protein